jgi:hypothetical protein
MHEMAACEFGLGAIPLSFHTYYRKNEESYYGMKQASLVLYSWKKMQIQEQHGEMSLKH